MTKIRVLFCAANPFITERLSIDREIREIMSRVRSAEHRDLIELVSIWAVRPDDLLTSLNMHRPQIVHFSGHGTSDGGIILENDLGEPKPVTTKALTSLFTALKDDIRLVVLNACYSELQAASITQEIDCTIGMSGKISDEAAIKFISAFYSAIGFGRSIKDAFEQGKTALILAGIAEEDVPVLLTKPGIDPASIVLTQLKSANTHNVTEAQPAISFNTLIAASTRDFVGRGFVFEEINSFVQENESGYFWIKGDPGIGKTALLSQLIKRENLIHHFNIIRQNIRSPYHFIFNVCSQLIARFNLKQMTMPTSNELKDGIFLIKCLEAAIEKNDTQRLLIALDALDEADWRDLPMGVNIHYLPRDLPQGVYFIVTSRFDSDIPLAVANLQVFNLKQDSANNISDVHQYVENYSRRYKMQTLLEQQEVDRSIFIDEVTEKSQGNFMYLRYVLPAIEKRSLLKNGIEQLPQGLEAYYRLHWGEMKIEIGGEFEKSHELVISVLAAMPEPVPLDAIAEWTKLSWYEVNKIKIAWEPFLFEESINGEVRYRLYHTSFGEFLGRQVNLDLYKDLVAEAIFLDIIRERL